MEVAISLEEEQGGGGGGGGGGREGGPLDDLVWGGVCDRGFGREEAEVVCREVIREMEASLAVKRRKYLNW